MAELRQRVDRGGLDDGAGAQVGEGVGRFLREFVDQPGGAVLVWWRIARKDRTITSRRCVASQFTRSGGAVVVFKKSGKLLSRIPAGRRGPDAAPRHSGRNPCGAAIAIELRPAYRITASVVRISKLYPAACTDFEASVAIFPGRVAELEPT